MKHSLKQLPNLNTFSGIKLLIILIVLSIPILTSCTIDPDWMGFYFNGNESDESTAEVTIEWDPNTEPDLAGYKVYYGNISGNYDYEFDAGNNTIGISP